MCDYHDHPQMLHVFGHAAFMAKLWEHHNVADTQPLHGRIVGVGTPERVESTHSQGELRGSLFSTTHITCRWRKMTAVSEHERTGQLALSLGFVLLQGLCW